MPICPIAWTTPRAVSTKARGNPVTFKSNPKTSPPPADTMPPKVDRRHSVELHRLDEKGRGGTTQVDGFRVVANEDKCRQMSNSGSLDALL